MNPVKIYRLTVILGPILAILGIVYTEIARSSFSQSWQDLLTWSGDEALLSCMEGESCSEESMWGIALLLIFLLLAVANQIAMYFFWRPSRHIYGALYLLGVLTILGCGLLVAPPIEYFLMEVSMFLSGMTLALCYFSPPVVNRFLSTSKGDKVEDSSS